MSDRQTHDGPRSNRLKVEHAIWIALLMLGMALRLSNLNAAQLNASEARAALAAWRTLSQGGNASIGEGANQGPLLLITTALTFAMFGASDSAARLWPALIGSVLILTPCLLRKLLGRSASLAAGLFLTISPTMLVASRQADGSALAALGCMLVIGGTARYLDCRDGRWLGMVAVGMAMAITASALAYTLLIPLGGATVVVSWVYAWPVRAAWARFRGRRSCGLVVFLAVSAAFSTGLGWRPMGVADSAELAQEWAAGFLVGAASPNLLTVAWLYEFLPLGLAIGGATWAARHRRQVCTLLGVWTALALVLVSLRRSAPPLETTAVALPACLLAAITLQALIDRMRRPEARLARSVLLPSVVMVAAYIWLLAAYYAKQGRASGLVLIVMALGVEALLVVAVAYVMQPSHVGAGIASGCVAALLVLTVSVGWGASHVRPNDPRELILHQPTDPGVQLLLKTITETSWKRTGTPQNLAFAFQSDRHSVLAWYLRDFPAAQRFDPGQSVTLHEAAAMPYIAGPDATSPPPPTAVGQDFSIARSWDGSGLTCTWQDVASCARAAQHSQTTNGNIPACAWYERLTCTVPVRWLLYRSEPPLQSLDTAAAVLWVPSAP